MTDKELTEAVRDRLVGAVRRQDTASVTVDYAVAYAALKGLDRPAPAQPVAVPQELADAVWHVVDMWEDSLPSPSGKDWRPDWLNNLAEITEKYIPREASDER